MNQVEILREISAQVRVCQACELHYSRKNGVPGEGNPSAEIMFIGEGPGFHENEQGRPFVGPAGKFLDELLAEAGYQRDQVFIANVVKCRPPGNRDPLPEELAACSRYLDKQIETINPCVIVTLGRISMGKFLPNGRISEIHGKSIWVHDRLVVAMYHPAAALHQPSLKPVLITDFRSLKGVIASARAAGRNQPIQAPAAPVETNPAQDKPEQLTLF